MGEKFWLNEVDKGMVESVLGREAFEFSASGKVLSEFASLAGDLGNSALIWGAGYCREAKGSEVGTGSGSQDRKHEGGDRKRSVLQKLHACFGWVKEDNCALNLDLVSDVEMFYLTSMKIRILEAEKDMVNYKQKWCTVGEIDFQGRHDNAVVRVSCLLDSHPVSTVIKAFSEHQVIAQESNVATTEEVEIVLSKLKVALLSI
ncbi:hypothetical protein Vadar_015439 [Vaccinium darrowii]|uniref:Uncharacterized protein n=1 Tax=Vaccinium darrowii TaxID=229202 RepID=A0ACB7ZBU9_9ERIC|nr:hypothetical protein Vadar_015439 [Vaccinium darrowii]